MAEPEPTIISIEIGHPQGFGGHVFELTSEDLFQCVQCHRYEITLRDSATGEIQPCPNAEGATP